ncbi:hypothetical protein DL769_003586 [Monosporascus sp. CRB-8-3]|nr:hypothetical protein DL769_003586 [Monosporascus sp. CRB-8-3]
MRYEDWDVLLFPKGSKIPMKEFKTNCHVVQDAEFPYTQGSYGLPTMTCFVPGLRPGTPFNISLHCWQTPEISHFTKNSFSEHLDLVKFEARVLIDGRLVAYVLKHIARNYQFHHLMGLGVTDLPHFLAPDRGRSCSTLVSVNNGGSNEEAGSKANISEDFTKDGELEPLKFPQFRSELLRQSYWNPADELGRIKIIISEGFPRDSLSAPIERVKNIVAFSFQHAPIDILESSGIAWPNPAMWRRGPFNPSMPVPTQHPKEGAEVHLHSPRRQSSYKTTTTNSSGHSSGIPGLTSVNASTSTILSSMPNTQALLQRGWSGSGTSYNDPFSHQNSDPLSYPDWSNDSESIGYNQSAADQGRSSYNPATTRKNTSNRRIMTNSDISMPDFGLVNPNTLQFVPETLNFAGNSLDDPDIGTQGPTVPTNTPTTMGFVDDLGIDVNKIDTPPTSEFFGTNSQISSTLATSLTHSLLNQPHPLPVHAANIPLPASEIKSRKENRGSYTGSVDNTPTVERRDIRKVSQSAFSNLSKDSTDNGNDNSPPGSRTFSGIFSQRSVSAGEFGHDLTNVNNVTNSNSDSNRANSNQGGFTDSNQGSGKDTKQLARHNRVAVIAFVSWLWGFGNLGRGPVYIPYPRRILETVSSKLGTREAGKGDEKSDEKDNLMREKREEKQKGIQILSLRLIDMPVLRRCLDARYARQPTTTPIRTQPNRPRKAYLYGAHATYRSQQHIARPGVGGRVATKSDVRGQDDALPGETSIFKTSATLRPSHIDGSTRPDLDGLVMASTKRAVTVPAHPTTGGPPLRPATRLDFAIAVICASPLEADAVDALFDHHWDDDGPPYDKAPGDPNAYSTGAVGRHNVVLAHMPGVGKVNAAAVAANCRASFLNIKLAIVVGVCGVAPFSPDGDEIVLGDVIISDGVIQSDLGRRLPDRFVRKDTLLDSLGRPNAEIRALLAKLKGIRGRKMLRGKIAGYLDALGGKSELAAQYPGIAHDRLFEATYRHVSGEMLCEECGCNGRLVPRRRLAQDSPRPAVHFNLIASGDTVMKSGVQRDAIARQDGVVGFEMEGAGVWDIFPCVVIKGACNYADSHKSKTWQRYAAAASAACMKAFLDHWVPSLPASSVGQPSYVNCNNSRSSLPRRQESPASAPVASGELIRPRIASLSTLRRNTQIALEYAYWLQDACPDMSVFWVHANNAERFRQAYACIAQEHRISGYDDPKRDVLPLVKRWLESKDRGRRLMVVDNADDTQLFFGQPVGPEIPAHPATKGISDDNSDQDMVDLLSEKFETDGRDSDAPHAVAETEKQQGQEPRREIQLTKALWVPKAFSFVAEDKGHGLDMHRLVQLVTRKCLVKQRTLSQFARQALSTVSQSPRVYATYEFGKGIPENVVAAMYVVTFASAGISASFVGSLADKFGRKRACLLYCALCFVSCLSVLSDSLPILFFGRICGGVCTTLLLSVFEAWMVSEHHERCLPIFGLKLSSVFGNMTTISCTVTVVSTLAGDIIIQHSGSQTAPFLAASVCCVGAAYLIARFWNENFGARSTGGTWMGDVGEDTLVMTRKPRIFALGVMSCFFEGTVYLFLFYCFMCATMAGSIIFTLLSAVHTTQGAFNVVMAVAVVAGCCLSLGGVLQTESLLFWALCLFEVCVGAYLPSMAYLKSEVVEDGVRGRTYSLLRFPINVFVLVAYGLRRLAMHSTHSRLDGVLMGDLVGDVQRNRVFFVCSGLLLVAFLVARRNF